MGKHRIDNGGLAVDAATRKYMSAHPTADYHSACRAVIKHYTDASQAGSRSTWSPYQANISSGAGPDTPNIQRLRDVVLSCPRGSDGAPDPDIAVEIINADFMELGRGAAGDFLATAAHREISNKGESVPTSQDRKTYSAAFDAALRKVSKTYPEIFLAYSKGIMTVPGIKGILRRDPGLKSYSAVKRYD